MANQKALEILGRTFPQLDTAQRAELYKLARITSYPPGTTLCEEGADEGTFYIVVAGELDVFKRTEHGPRLINRMGPGEHFGEMALLLTEARTTTVITASDVTVIEIERTVFEQHIRTNADLLIAMNQLTVHRLLKREERFAAQLPDPAQKSPQIFVCYARANSDFVFKLIDDLGQRGFNLWIDQRNIPSGTIWSQEVEKALESSAVLLLVLSPESVDSRHVADEWHYFLEEEKPIIPVLYVDCQIPYQLRRIQYVDFTQMAYETALRRLQDQFRAVLD